ncbi:SDR family NAD(P)-dependent oxidoreductase [Roseomonas xinghualingensis]|uniref:SDR family NAD(P)-dependent oxidoreductase n=1 Tax=Roseomonas xinghualingensis TaxID=2986475 RepID=UPI0021F0CFFD|nr:SDR family NAD(P)-dependent oxidoreductase [Roseomonas sp. SXEYE001]
MGAGSRLPPFLTVLLLGIWLVGCAAPSQLGAGGRERIAGRVYVVTGASSGFGRGVAVRLGSYGAHVVLAARRGAVLEEVASEVRAGGGQALVVPTDVAEPEAVERLARAAVERFGRIDVWINNAAVGAVGRFEEVPFRDHARIVDVNLKGALHGSHVALRQFRRQGSGVLVNISSVEGHVPLAYHASYAATKAALVGFGGALHQELRLAGLDDRIQVSTVLPWAADTPFWEHGANYSGRSARMAMMDGPEEVVDAIVWTSIHPVKEYAVGWKAQGAVVGDQIWPRAAEYIAGNIVHRSQMEEASPAPVTAGSVHEPVARGTGVEGGVRARKEAEDRAREGG